MPPLTTSTGHRLINMKTPMDSNVLQEPPLKSPSATHEQNVGRERQAQPGESKMDRTLVLLFTPDPNFQKLLAAALLTEDLSVLVTRSVNHALQTVCARSEDLKFVVIDFDDGYHGMTLLRAINACHRELPIIVVTSGDLDHTAAFAYVNCAAVCFAKPITASDIQLVLTELRQPKLYVIGA
jgi:ActR/RegA family two-component response regulator